MPAVLCNNIENIFWKKEHAVSSLSDFTIDIWRATLSPDLWMFNHFDKILSKDEMERADRYHQENDRQRFIISKGILKFILAKYLNQSPAKIKLITGLNKKPILQHHQKGDLHFNVAHSGACILIAIAKTEIGVDVEKMDHGFSYQEILATNFNTEEKEFVQRSKQPQQDFYLLWTRKEALLKATAKGIDDDLHLIPSLHGDHHLETNVLHSDQDWKINSFQMAGEYIGSVAHHWQIEQINFLDAPSSFFLHSV